MRTAPQLYLGYDIGASSGRAVIGTLRGGRLRMREIYRFPNGAVELGGRLYWDFLALWAHIIEGLRVCRREGMLRLAGIGIDTWGVDYGLLGRDGQLLANPVCYRDSRTIGIEKVLNRRFSPQAFYRITGQAVNRIMTVSQLMALKRGAGRRLLETADCLLMMPDLLRYFLCGRRNAELTIVGSSQLVDIRSRQWSARILRGCGLPRALFPKLIRAGRFAAPLRPELATQTGIEPVRVAVVAGHDTTSAAAAAPLADRQTIFLSSGTWSVFGIASPEPYLSEESRKAGFINELGFETVLFVKNMMGLYLVENLKRQWAKSGRAVSYAAMIRTAAAAKPFRFIVDLNAPLFFATDDVETAVGSFLRSTDQRGKPASGELVRTLLESLAFSYRQALLQLERLVPRNFRRICLVGGGVQNRLLCQMSAAATGLTVEAGPVEATVAGNLCLQALADGRVEGLAGIKHLVARSFASTTYEPRDTAVWEENFERYLEICAKAKQRTQKG
jgi:rhamnulokinase/L-fuculokinase